MQFLAIASLFLATAFAAPSMDSHGHGVARRHDNALCPSGLYSNPQCCNLDVLGVAGIDCVPRKDSSSKGQMTSQAVVTDKQGTAPSKPSNCKSFAGICASIGREPKCCVLPVAGQAVLCEDPVGGNF
ncbi:hypothetical protein Trco_007139 [Trichoderma cornu-damae]|uniref:Hydrophobin n=1 Tax=Trichoderma cornu-damae TaxID=654480 RepID=A0A9P8QMX3_9HYPO|nr:hypothetical protein Trco_007139 [Trichoderma cornu-damae]